MPAKPPPSDASIYSSKLIRGVSWSALQRLGSQAIQGIVFLLLARLLEPKDFGLLSLALVYVTFLQIFVEQGVGDAIIQRPEIDLDYLDTAFWTNLLSGMVFCAVGWAVAGPVAGCSASRNSRPILRWLSLLFPLTALTIVPQCLLRREMRFKTLATCSMLQFSIERRGRGGHGVQGCGRLEPGRPAVRGRRRRSRWRCGSRRTGGPGSASVPPLLQGTHLVRQQRHRRQRAQPH